VLWKERDPMGYVVTLHEDAWDHILERRGELLPDDYRPEFLEELRLAAIDPLAISVNDSREYGPSIAYVRCVRHPEFHNYVVTMYAKEWRSGSDRVVRSAVISSGIDRRLTGNVLHGTVDRRREPCGGSPRAAMQQRLIADESIIRQLRAAVRNSQVDG